MGRLPREISRANKSDIPAGSLSVLTLNQASAARGQKQHAQNMYIYMYSTCTNLREFVAGRGCRMGLAQRSGEYGVGCRAAPRGKARPAVAEAVAAAILVRVDHHKVQTSEPKKRKVIRDRSSLHVCF